MNYAHLHELQERTVTVEHRYSGVRGRWGFYVEPTMGKLLIELYDNPWTIDEILLNLTFINNYDG